MAKRKRTKKTGVPDLERESGSWIVTSPSGQVVELFERANAEKAHQAGWRVETALQYLARINREGKARRNPDDRVPNDAGSFALGAVGGAAAIIISNIVRGSPGVQYADLIAKAEKQANAGDFGQAKQTLAKADKAREKAVQQVGGLNDNIEIGDRFRGSLEQRIDRALASGSAGAAAQANPSVTEAELTKRLKF